MKYGLTCSLAASALLISGAADAHHSFAMFDGQKRVRVAGVVKEFQWTNPHVWIEVAVIDDKGAQSVWPIECASLVNLSRRGWTRNSLKPGDKVSVVIHPLKSQDLGGSMIKVGKDGQWVGDPTPGEDTGTEKP